MKKTLFVFIIFLLVSPFTFAQDSKEKDLKMVEGMVNNTITIVFDLLKNKSLEQGVRNQKIIDEMVPFFDFSRMSINSLGKKNYKKLKKAKRKEYKKAFIKSSQEYVTSKLNLFTDQTIEFKKAVFVKKRISVETVLISDNDKYDITFKFYKSKRKGWIVYDVILLGVSLTKSYRSQFSEALRSIGIDGLIAQLNKAGGMSVAK